jgi:hypothetical protein
MPPPALVEPVRDPTQVAQPQNMSRVGRDGIMLLRTSFTGDSLMERYSIRTILLFTAMSRWFQSHNNREKGKKS